MTTNTYVYSLLLLYFQIKKSDVDSFAPGKIVPECVLLLRWIKKDQQPVGLLHKVPLLGAGEQDFFTLYIEDSGTNVIIITLI